MINQIAYFISVVKNKNFTKAAEECHISQPAISQQIKELENTLGISLLDRKGRSFTVTPAGQYFYQHGQDLLTNYQELVKQTKQIAKAEKEDYVLNLGYLRDFGTDEFLQAVTKFSKEYPAVKVKINSGNHEDLFRMIENNQVDLNFSDLRRAASNKYVNDHLADSKFEVIINHALLKDIQQTVTSHELADMPCILVVGNSEKQSEIDYYHDILGIESEFVIVGTYTEAIVQAAAGAGYLITNERSGQSITDPSLKKLVLLNGRQPMIQHYYAFWKADNSGFYIESFAKILKEQFKS
ncbi:MAG: LysR family transcriptional regulator [Lactobacillus sp.]|jgi:DNA-binding transcriptional LysR family regulator|nr:LysR family transcriptional regulator [Lactobacillus sp.]